ncbi:MAG TPA: EF-hand domain-containing protein [Planctomycetaceae bacterium]|nr:EF-hand domain-containing protein [Planctomycetaceae bacterium]
MPRAFRLCALTLLLAGFPALSIAQESPGDDPPKPARAGGAKADSRAVDAIVSQLMAFDKNKDGKLTRDEVTDERLQRLFDRADANKDGVVTKEELSAFATKLAAEESAGGGRGRGFGPGGPGGPGSFGGPPRPGQILPPFLQQELKLTADQKQQITSLQKEVDEKLDKVLTDEQKKQLKDMRRGPGGGRRGRRGPGRPGPDGPDGPPGDERPEGPGPGSDSAP